MTIVLHKASDDEPALSVSVSQRVMDANAHSILHLVAAALAISVGSKALWGLYLCSASPGAT